MEKSTSSPIPVGLEPSVCVCVCLPLSEASVRIQRSLKLQPAPPLQRFLKLSPSPPSLSLTPGGPSATCAVRLPGLQLVVWESGSVPVRVNETVAAKNSRGL